MLLEESRAMGRGRKRAGQRAIRREVGGCGQEEGQRTKVEGRQRGGGRQEEDGG